MNYLDRGSNLCPWEWSSWDWLVIFQKVQEHFPKTIFLDVHRCRGAIIWSNKYRDKQINVKWVFLKVDFALPLIHKYSTMILQNVVKDRICSHFTKHVTADHFYTVCFEGLVICGSSTLVILWEERDRHLFLGVANLAQCRTSQRVGTLVCHE